MRRDRAGHAGAVGMRPLVVGRGLESGRYGPCKIGMGPVDLGIDDRDQNLAAARQAMRVEQLELLRGVLGAVDGLLLVLGEDIEVVRLCAGDHQPIDRVGAYIRDHVRHRGTAVDTPAVERPAGETQGAGFYLRHRMAPAKIIENLPGHAQRDVEDEFGRNETRLADRRQITAGAQRLNLGPDDALAAAAPTTSCAASSCTTSSCTTSSCTTSSCTTATP